MNWFSGLGLPSTLRTSYLRDMQLLDSGFVRFWALAGLALAAMLPFMLSNFWTGVANQALIAIVGALALNLLMGTTGQISLGHAGFVAAGAFTVAALITHFEAPLPVTLLAAALVGAALGVLVGLPALRLRGLYLAVSTLAAHFVIIVGLAQYQAEINYGSGFTVPAPAVLGVEIASERQWYFFLLPAAIAVLLLNLNWLRSAFGRAWMAIHHRDIAAQSLGINIAHYKLMAFAASTSLTCCSGALWAYHTGFVSVEAFDFHMLIQYLAMVIIGGLGSVLGAMLGAVFVTALPHVISLATEQIPMLQGMGGKVFEVQIGIFGLIMLLFLILEPRGLAGIWARIRFYFQLWPFKHRSWES
jgi:branched-chain amino acid transport system permease protein